MSETEFNELVAQFKLLCKDDSGLDKKQFAQIISEVFASRLDENTIPAFYRIYETFDADGFVVLSPGSKKETADGRTTRSICANPCDKEMEK